MGLAVDQIVGNQKPTVLCTFHLKLIYLINLFFLSFFFVKVSDFCLKKYVIATVFCIIFCSWIVCIILSLYLYICFCSTLSCVINSYWCRCYLFSIKPEFWCAFNCIKKLIFKILLFPIYFKFYFLIQKNIFKRQNHI